jgi:hypothetical protein
MVYHSRTLSKVAATVCRVPPPFPNLRPPISAPPLSPYFPGHSSVTITGR